MDFILYVWVNAALVAVVPQADADACERAEQQAVFGLLDRINDLPAVDGETVIAADCRPAPASPALARRDERAA